MPWPLQVLDMNVCFVPRKASVLVEGSGFSSHGFVGEEGRQVDPRHFCLS